MEQFHLSDRYSLQDSIKQKLGFCLGFSHLSDRYSLQVIEEVEVEVFVGFSHLSDRYSLQACSDGGQLQADWFQSPLG